MPRKASAYICYLRDPELHNNGAGSHAGIGDTPDQARAAACYRAGQVRCTVTVPISRAPRWAIEEAREAVFIAGLIETMVEHGYSTASAHAEPIRESRP